MSLLLTPENKIKEWNEVVTEILNSGKDIYLIGDTETTGGLDKKTNGISVIEKNEHDNLGKLHRILEVGFLVCIKNNDGLFETIKDNSGKEIFFHEYINPFSEPAEKFKKINSINDIPFGAYNVHGISKDFLSGKGKIDQGNGKFLKLKSSAPTFQEIIEPLCMVLGIFNEKRNEKTGKINSIFHNYEFDAKFMNSEFSNCNLHGEPFPSYESFIFPHDTIEVFKNVLTLQDIELLKQKVFESKKIEVKGRFALDTLVALFSHLELMDNSKFDRNLHGALKDSKILLELYNGIIKSDFYPKPYKTKEQNIADIRKFLTELISPPVKKINKNGIVF